MIDIENIKVEFDSETIKALARICEISGLDIPEVINTEFISRATNRIKELIISLKNQIEEKQQGIEEYLKTIEELKNNIETLKKADNSSTDETSIEIEVSKKTEENPPIKPQPETNKEKNKPWTPHIKSNISKILIIANVGAIMHQLKVIFKKYGREVVLVKSYSEAIKELKDNQFDCILFDMATSTDNDIMIIEALRKATEIQHTDTTLAVLMIPNKEGARRAKEKGADLVIEKHESWHINILNELKITTTK